MRFYFRVLKPDGEIYRDFTPESNYGAYCFGALATNEIWTWTNPSGKIEYILTRNINPNEVIRQYIDKVLMNPIFTDIFHPDISYQENSIVATINLVGNYYYTLVYLTMWRYIEESPWIIARWFEIQQAGVNPLQAFIIAEGYHQVPGTQAIRYKGYIPNTNHRQIREMLCQKYQLNPGDDYDWGGHNLIYIPIHVHLPFVDWPRIVLNQLKDSNPRNYLHGVNWAVNKLSWVKWNLSIYREVVENLVDVMTAEHIDYPRLVDICAVPELTNYDMEN